MDLKTDYRQDPSFLPYSKRGREKEISLLWAPSAVACPHRASLQGWLQSWHHRSAQLVCSWQIQKTDQIRARALNSTAVSLLYILKHWINSTGFLGTNKITADSSSSSLQVLEIAVRDWNVETHNWCTQVSGHIYLVIQQVSIFCLQTYPCKYLLTEKSVDVWESFASLLIDVNPSQKIQHKV